MRNVHFCYIMLVEFHLHWMIQQIIRHNNGLSTTTFGSTDLHPSTQIFLLDLDNPEDPGGEMLRERPTVILVATPLIKVDSSDKTSVNTMRLHAQNSVIISVWRHRTYSMVETVSSSSQWISASNGGLSSDTTQCHRGAMTSSCHCNRDRWDYSGDNCCTTRHLCSSLHIGLTTRRCPGLECWTSVRDGMSVNHLHTTDSSLIYKAARHMSKVFYFAAVFFLLFMRQEISRLSERSSAVSMSKVDFYVLVEHGTQTFHSSFP